MTSIQLVNLHYTSNFAFRQKRETKKKLKVWGGYSISGNFYIARHLQRPKKKKKIENLSKSQNNQTAQELVVETTLAISAFRVELSCTSYPFD